MSSSDETRWRLFLAIPLQHHLCRRLHRVQEQLAASFQQGWSMRWSTPEQMHLTLKFLGDVEKDRTPDVTEGAREASELVSSFSLQFEGLGAFPGWNRPRVVWAGVRPEAQLDRLVGGLEDSLGKRGFGRERLAFTPHVTIGRVRRGRRVDNPPVGGEYGWLSVSGFSLIRSVLGPAGPRYETLEQIGLAAV